MYHITIYTDCTRFTIYTDSSGKSKSWQYKLHVCLPIKLFFAVIDKLPVQNKYAESSSDTICLEAISGLKRVHPQPWM